MNLGRGKPAVSLLRLRVAYWNKGTKEEECYGPRSPSMKHSNLHIFSGYRRFTVSFDKAQEQRKSRVPRKMKILSRGAVCYMT